MAASDGRSVVFRSGNVLEVRRPAQDTRDEVKRYLQALIQEASSTANGESTANDSKLYLGASDHIRGEERSTLAINVKIFLLAEMNPLYISDAVRECLECLGTDKLDNVHVSLPVDASDSHDQFAAVWKALEAECDGGRVGSIGVADFNFESLQALVDKSRIHPSVNHVNLQSCCVMPKDLVDYAKTAGIQLLTHADQREVLSKEAFDAAVGGSSGLPSPLAPTWLVRYQATYPSRGVIASKGYILSAAVGSGN
eukprot:Opistho-2@3463